jgi:hypothetical protein
MVNFICGLAVGVILGVALIIIPAVITVAGGKKK